MRNVQIIDSGITTAMTIDYGMGMIVENTRVIRERTIEGEDIEIRIDTDESGRVVSIGISESEIVRIITRQEEK